MTGLVIRNTGSWVDVRTDEGEVVQCKVKGNFRLKGIRSTSPVVVGDNVVFERNREGTAFIQEICDRRNYIIRKASNLSKQSHILAANIDVCLLVVTLRQPVTSVVFIDRFLATAEAYRVPVCIIINKVDLLTPEEQAEAEKLAKLYKAVGYEVMVGSVIERRGLESLPSLLKDKTALQAVAETTIPGCLENLAEEVADLLSGKVKGTEALDSRNVNKTAPKGQVVEGAEGGGVHTAEVSLRDSLCPGSCAGHQHIEQFRLSYTRIASQQCCFVLKQRGQGL